MNDQQNQGCRVAGIDLARGLSLVFMILSHTQLYFRKMLYASEDAGYATLFDRFADDFLASDASAPVFMFVMGMCMVYSRRAGVGYWISRGFRMLLTALFLAVVIMGGLVALYRWLMLPPGEIMKDGYVQEQLFQGDILHFVGLTFMVFALMKHLRFGWRAMLLLTGGLYAAYTAFLLTLGSEILPWPACAFVGWFCGTDHLSCFPLFAWLVYPVAGYILAEALGRSADPGKLLRRAGIVGLIVFLAAFSVSWPYSFVDFPLMGSYDGQENAFYHQHPVRLLRCCGWVFFEIWICELLARKLPGAVMSQFRRWSVNVNAMYILSWFIIFFAAEFLFHEQGALSIPAWLAGAVTVFALTDFCVTMWKRRRR